MLREIPKYLLELDSCRQNWRYIPHHGWDYHGNKVEQRIYSSTPPSKEKKDITSLFGQ